MLGVGKSVVTKAHFLPYIQEQEYGIMVNEVLMNTLYFHVHFSEFFVFSTFTYYGKPFAEEEPKMQRQEGRGLTNRSL